MTPLAYIALGSAAWAASHAWCHARCRALAAGDLEGLSDPLGPSGGLVAAGIARGDVSPDVAEKALSMCLISREDALRTRSGAYRRRYDRTAVADVPWLVAFIGAAALGAESSLAWAGMMCCATWAAMADARFRIVPAPCAAAMALLAVACNGADAPRAVALLAVSAAALGLLSALAKATGSAFGAGDVAITACCLTALGGPRRWAPFAGTLLILLTIALIASASGNRAAGRGRARPTLVPFGCFAAPALACALAGTL